ncbi:MAG: CDP-diacylglycerol--serine O-phosphatidyltransferase [Proteobacteria bacterium]|nr:CDP-diacylglycerol--serine O-phosphatidyltransferase [Pseudomonadota bacterium]MBU1709318.1 CDP-diacylglycerol--serine O-phosphatidyltransferase [Pseudomonadota bacterium]
MKFSARRDEAPKGSIYLLPSMLTTASLFSGFYAIVSAMNGMYFNAAVAIIIAAIFDGLDGRVARMTGTTSRFGMEYDSLCDLVSFGVAPAVLAYLWVLKPYGRYGWLAAFLYVATTALRLARFNTQDCSSSQNTFTGLPCPAAAGMIATSVLFFEFIDFEIAIQDKALLALVYVLSYLMVSTHHYQSFKHPETTRAKTFHALVVMVLLIMVLATEPQVTLFFLGLIYVLSGPVHDGFKLFVKEGNESTEEEHKTL